MIDSHVIRPIEDKFIVVLGNGKEVGVTYDCVSLQLFISDMKYKTLFNMPIEKKDLDRLNLLFSTASFNINGPKKEENMKKHMPFRQAWFELLNGKKVRLSSWKGYWAWENNTIMMHCADGTALDIRKTDNPAFTLSNIATDDWEVVEEK